MPIVAKNGYISLPRHPRVDQGARAPGALGVRYACRERGKLWDTLGYTAAWGTGGQVDIMSLGAILFQLKLTLGLSECEAN